jgi:hypothetical protein
MFVCVDVGGLELFGSSVLSSIPETVQKYHRALRCTQTSK